MDDLLYYVAIAAVAAVVVMILWHQRRTARQTTATTTVRGGGAPTVDPREARLDDSVTTIRRILLKLADVIRRTGGAADDSTQNLSEVRSEISRLSLGPELEDAQQLLLQEIDRVAKSNSTLQVELANAHTALAEQRRELENLRTAVRIDALTGLGNRAHFEEQLSLALDRFRRYSEVFSLLMVDIDFFKNVNDEHGHVVGDKILVSLADLFKATLRSSDFKARYGGEEFAVIILKASEKDAKMRAEELRGAVARQGFRVGESAERIRLTISIGVAAVRAEDTPKSLVERADKALYEAKNQGRDRVCVASDLPAAQG